MAANGVEGQLLVFDRCKSRDGDGRLHAHLCRRLGHSGVADMANLAMLFVGRVSMPVPSCLHGKHTHAKHEGHGQQSYG